MSQLIPQYISSLPSQTWNTTRPRTLAILGSTGSIGINALDVVARNPEHFALIALAGGKNVARLLEQALRFRPSYLAMQDEDSLKTLAAQLPSGYTPHLDYGTRAFESLASLPEINSVLSAQVGAAGLAATMSAVNAGKVIALANKESLVLAGDLLREGCKRTGAVILPVDSEHHALFQALQGRPLDTVTSLLITASGGPFRTKNAKELAKVTVAEALDHPRWNMGAKISIDSATLMNKGLELIEAAALFAMPLEKMEVVIHPESIIHSMVTFRDASLLAHLSQPDMRIPISHCLVWPDCLDCGVPALDFFTLKTLTFEKPNISLFPCLSLAMHALQSGKGLPIVLNAANEVVVQAFLQGRIGFMDIPRLIEQSLNQAIQQGLTKPTDLETIMHIDNITRLSTGQWNK